MKHNLIEGYICFLSSTALQFIRTFWQSLVLCLTPLLACSVFLALDDDTMSSPLAVRCLYVLIVMAVFWVTEVLPVPVTSLIPVVAFPALGIMGSVSE